jgi:hypothetical protein
MAIPLGRPLPSASCDRPERRREGSPGIPANGGACRSYLVLLPVGFSLPPPSPAARCALTAPFHPCRPPEVPDGAAVYFLWHFPWGRPRRALPGTVPPWSPDFPPSAQRQRAAIRPSGTRNLGVRDAPVKAGRDPDTTAALDHGILWAVPPQRARPDRIAPPECASIIIANHPRTRRKGGTPCR